MARGYPSTEVGWGMVAGVTGVGLEWEHEVSGEGSGGSIFSGSGGSIISGASDAMSSFYLINI